MTAYLDSLLIGHYVIARTYSAGVFAGMLHYKRGKEIILINARRLWYWKGAASLSQLAMEGVQNPDECMFPCQVSKVLLTEVTEILKTTKKAQESIKGVKIWKATGKENYDNPGSEHENSISGYGNDNSIDDGLRNFSGMGNCISDGADSEDDDGF